MLKIGVVAQKGGVGKTSLSAMILSEYARAGWNVLGADMDTSQCSLCEWGELRNVNKLKPYLEIKPFNFLRDVLKKGLTFDLVVFDGAPHSTVVTKEIANACDLILLPTGVSIMDLKPQVELAHELVLSGIDRAKLLFVLLRCGDSKLERDEALQYIKSAGYTIALGYIPERIAYRRGFLEGRSLAECRYPSLRSLCEPVLQDIANILNK